MTTSQWNYSLTWWDASDNFVTTRVIENKDVDSIPLFTDQGSGEVNQMILKLNCLNGAYITQTNSGLTPIIDQFDKFNLIATDGLGGSYDRNFEVIRLIPAEDAATGTSLEIHCLGNEWYTQNIHYSKPFYFTTAFPVGQDIGDSYNANKGTLQPLMINHDVDYIPATSQGNQLPKFTNNHYDYGTQERPGYDVWMDLIDKLGGSVDDGGALDFFELGFDSNSSNINEISFRLFSAGGPPEDDGGTPVTIDVAESVNTGLDESEAGIEAQRGTHILAWGEFGAIPKDFARYQGVEYDFLFRGAYVNTVTYKIDSKVESDGKHWQALNENTGVTPVEGANWTEITFVGEVENIQYSPWTDDKANLWIAAGSNSQSKASTPNAAQVGGTADPFLLFGAGMWDGNLVINFVDESNNAFFRTWAVTSDNTQFTFPSEFAYDTDDLNGVGPFPRGHRILNKPPFVVAGTDPITGLPFENSIIIITETFADEVTQVFKVLYTPDDTKDKLQCAVLDDGIVWEWTSTGAGASGNWKPLDEFNSDCFHNYQSVLNVKGVQEDQHTFIGPVNTDSAVEVTFNIPDIVDNASADYNQGFAGLCFQFPFPNMNGVLTAGPSFSEAVGEVYGGGDGPNEQHEPATFDPQNMHQTPDGFRGFNQTDSEEYGTTTHLTFFTKITETIINDKVLRMWSANIPIRVTAYDTADNVMTCDKVIPFNNNWTQVACGLSEFKIYRGAIPIAKAFDSINAISPKLQDNSNIFEWRNLKLVSIQIQSFYDEFGRFNPLQVKGTDAITTLTNLFATVVMMPNRTITMTIDSLNFAKRILVSVSDEEDGRETDRNIEPPFMQRNQIFSYSQLRSDAASELELAKFRRRQFDVVTQGAFDIRFGESFFYTNPRIVFLPADEQTDPGESENTIKLVAKKIEYSLTKNQGGIGGIVRKIYGSKRFT